MYGLSFYFTCWFTALLVWPEFVTNCTLTHRYLLLHHTEMGTSTVVDQTLLGHLWKQAAAEAEWMSFMCSLTILATTLMIYMLAKKESKDPCLSFSYTGCHTHRSHSSCRRSLVCSSRRMSRFRLHIDLHFGRGVVYTGHHLHTKNIKHTPSCSEGTVCFKFRVTDLCFTCLTAVAGPECHLK